MILFKDMRAWDIVNDTNIPCSELDFKKVFIDYDNANFLFKGSLFYAKFSLNNKKKWLNFKI